MLTQMHTLTPTLGPPRLHGHKDQQPQLKRPIRSTAWPAKASPRAQRSTAARTADPLYHTMGRSKSMGSGHKDQPPLEQLIHSTTPWAEASPRAQRSTAAQPADNTAPGKINNTIEK